MEVWRIDDGVKLRCLGRLKVELLENCKGEIMGGCNPWNGLIMLRDAGWLFILIKQLARKD